MSKQIALTVSLALIAGVVALPAYSVVKGNGLASTKSEQSFQLAHAGTGHSSHKHCHNRVRRGKVIKVCHRHSHRVLHHL